VTERARLLVRAVCKQSLTAAKELGLTLTEAELKEAYEAIASHHEFSGRPHRRDEAPAAGAPSAADFLRHEAFPQRADIPPPPGPEPPRGKGKGTGGER